MAAARGLSAPAVAQDTRVTALQCWSVGFELACIGTGKHCGSHTRLKCDTHPELGSHIHLTTRPAVVLPVIPRAP